MVVLFVGYYLLTSSSWIIHYYFFFSLAIISKSSYQRSVIVDLRPGTRLMSVDDYRIA